MLTPEPVTNYEPNSGFTRNYDVDPRLSHIVIGEAFDPEEHYAVRAHRDAEGYHNLKPGFKVAVKNLRPNINGNSWYVEVDMGEDTKEFDITEIVGRWVYEDTSHIEEAAELLEEAEGLLQEDLAEVVADAKRELEDAIDG